MTDADHHGSALRNRGPILEELQKIFAAESTGIALEVASGTGAHIELIAAAFPGIAWQPSEYLPDAPGVAGVDVGKIGSRGTFTELQCLDSHGVEKLANVRPAVALDVSTPYASWPQAVRDNSSRHTLVLCSNVLHISPWECTVGLFAGAGQALAPKGHLVVYGPFKIDGKFVGPDGGASNAAFDVTLKARDPRWGYRDVADVAQEAGKNGLALQETVAMPANNVMLHFVKE